MKDKPENPSKFVYYSFHAKGWNPLQTLIAGHKGSRGAVARASDSR